MVIEFWKRFNIGADIATILEAWSDVTKECLHYVSWKIFLDLICDFEELEASEKFFKIQNKLLV